MIGITAIRKPSFTFYDGIQKCIAGAIVPKNVFSGREIFSRPVSPGARKNSAGATRAIRSGTLHSVRQPCFIESNTVSINSYCHEYMRKKHHL
ncbi:hypothetical protein [Herminiimonas sp. CN]|uniref:hypothetical protein n=1 Tax=Herminiimonas sp. CN TaxID=1349818 RepID=UPI0012DF7963|nr:hypothetical protein [Herminiimonas sp. CN]